MFRSDRHLFSIASIGLLVVAALHTGRRTDSGASRARVGGTADDLR